MIEGYDIICFSNDWDGDPLSKKHIMTRLARRNRVLWVNSIGNRNPTASARDLKRMMRKLWDFGCGCRQVAPNLYTFTPLAIPFHGSPSARAFNRRWLSFTVRLVSWQLGFRHPITWSFVPASAEIAGQLGERKIIYHCVDEFSEFSGADKSAILDMERQLIERSDAVIVCSSPLFRSKCALGTPTFLVTHGVEVDHFRKACDPRTPIPDDIRRIRQPIIGFFGLIEDWVDLPLIRFLAESRPEWSFVLIGKSATDTSLLAGVPNVHLLGRKDYEELPGYCKAFSAALLPFVVNELTLNANPLKLREYLAAGLPVVASAIPEAARLEGLVEIARGPEDFLQRFDRLIAFGRTGPDIVVSRLMESETWDHKVEELSRIVEKTVRQKERRLAA